MKRYIRLLAILLTAISVTSCQKDTLDNIIKEQGGFSLALTMTDNESVATRVAMTNKEAIDNANVKIYKPVFGGLIREYTYSSMPGVVYLPTGNGYRVDVSAGEIVSSSPRKANFEQKSYKGSAEFNVVANQVTDNVNVVAKICNAITNATFDATIAENFEEGYTLTYALSKEETDPNKTLVYTADKSGKDGYFIIDEILLETKIYWTFQGTLKSDGTPFTAQGVISASTDSDDADTIADLVGARQKMTFKYVVKDGILKFEIEVDTKTEDIEDNIAWAPTSTGVSPSKSYEIWATYATIHADVDTDTYNAEKVYFQYRKKTEGDTEQWSELVLATRNDTSGAYDALIKGLNPSTTYEYQLVVYDAKDTDAETEIDGIFEFTTGKDQQVPNASFEDYHMAGSSSGLAEQYPRFFYAEANIESHRTQWWDSGNEASADYGFVICGTSTDAKDGQTAAKLQSAYAIAKFAAGNLFSGDFAGLDGLNGMVDFGRYFSCRPTGVKFYIRYKGGIVDYNSQGGPLATDKNTTDIGQIKIALGTWSNKVYGGATAECPVRVNTSKKETFWNIEALPETIAYTEHICTNVEDSGWLEVTLKLDYKNNKFPTHIIISAASSMYGDYFNGCSSSTMYLDDIKLLYDHPDDIQAGVVAVQ